MTRTPTPAPRSRRRGSPSWNSRDGHDRCPNERSFRPSAEPSPPGGSARAHPGGAEPPAPTADDWTRVRSRGAEQTAKPPDRKLLVELRSGIHVDPGPGHGLAEEADRSEQRVVVQGHELGDGRLRPGSLGLFAGVVP